MNTLNETIWLAALSTFIDTSRREFSKSRLCLKSTFSLMGGHCDYWPRAQKYLATTLVLDKPPYK